MAILTHPFVFNRPLLWAVLPLLISCSDGAGKPAAAPSAIPVVIHRISSAPWRDSINALGTTRADESVTVTAKVSETVRRVAFDSGDVVEAGDVLVDLSSGVELAGLEEARADYREAERLLRRQQELAERQLVAASEIDTQRAARDAARARMDVIRAELSNRVITAPFDGVLGVRQVSVGSLVTPGTPIATLDDLTTIKLDFSVPERFLATISEGQQVSARSDTYPERTFSAKVSHIDARVDPVTRSVALIAEIPNADRTLRPGMLMSVTLYGPSRQALVLPEIAVVQVGLDSFVFRIKPDQTAERVKVEPGSRRKGEVEIVEGLDKGDRVVTDGVVKMTEGVRVSEVDTGERDAPPAVSAADSPDAEPSLTGSAGASPQSAR